MLRISTEDEEWGLQHRTHHGRRRRRRADVGSTSSCGPAAWCWGCLVGVCWLGLAAAGLVAALWLQQMPTAPLEQRAASIEEPLSVSVSVSVAALATSDEIAASPPPPVRHAEEKLPAARREELAEAIAARAAAVKAAAAREAAARAREAATAAAATAAAAAAAAAPAATPVAKPPPSPEPRPPPPPAPSPSPAAPSAAAVAASAAAAAAAASAASAAAAAASAAAAAAALTPCPAAQASPCVCFEAAHATGVAPRDEGAFGTSDPVLWLYEGQANFATLQKSAVVMDSLAPEWAGVMCVSSAPRADGRICFDIRDDFDPDFPPDQPPLLHFGCTDEPTPVVNAAAAAAAAAATSGVSTAAFNAWSSEAVTLRLSGGATLTLQLVPTQVAPPPAPPSPPSPPRPPPPPPHPPCLSEWCGTFDSWVADRHSKFHGMWGGAWVYRKRHEDGCWGGGAQAAAFFASLLSGDACDRNWVKGSAAPQLDDRPAFTAAAPALLGFDETILDYCSQLLGWDMDGFDGADLNDWLATRCVAANRNVLRLLDGAAPWDMCQNLQWQMCALLGRLPMQDGAQVSFATAPRDARLEWWVDPDHTHPTYKPVADGYALSDVYFAELCVTYTLCANRAELWSLDVGEMFVCEFDEPSFWNLARQLQRLG